MGRGCLTEEHIQELVRIVEKILTEHFSRYDARQGEPVTRLSLYCIADCSGICQQYLCVFLYFTLCPLLPLLSAIQYKCQMT